MGGRKFGWMGGRANDERDEVRRYEGTVLRTGCTVGTVPLTHTIQYLNIKCQRATCPQVCHKRAEVI